MKGLILAGGTGSRLKPLTNICCKQLLPIYDKPMIYYPLSTLMLAGIRQICIISTPKDTPILKSVLGSGDKLGCSFEYIVQESPRGIADAFIVSKEFINNSPCALILGDNIFYGSGLTGILNDISTSNIATVFAYPVKDPTSFGVVEFDDLGNAVSIEEKPTNPKSNYAIPGLYFYDDRVVDFAKSLNPSSRGELEITDLNKLYLGKGDLKVKSLGRGIAWLDTGTFDNLLEASQFVQIIEAHQGYKVGCIEEIAWRKGYISNTQLISISKQLTNSRYGKYLESLLN